MIEQDIRKKTLHILNWIFGILFLLFASTELLLNTFSAVLFFIGSLLLIPPIKNRIEETLNYSITWQIKTILLVIIFLLGISFIELPEEESITQNNFKNEVNIVELDSVSSANKQEEKEIQETDQDIVQDIVQEEYSSGENVEQVSEQGDTASDIIFYSVVAVVDGDTIDVNINGNIERLRLIGLNTPETVDPRKPVECFGIEASNEARRLLLGKNVRLEADTTQQDKDIYGRLLRYVYLEDGLLYNKYMIEQGFAYEYTYNIPYIYQTEFKAAQQVAEQEKRGLWGYDCDQFEEESNNISEIQKKKNETIEVNANSGFYTSSHHSARLYYCSNDPQWEQLSERYLKFYETEFELLERYPEKTLHEPCSNF